MLSSAEVALIERFQQTQPPKTCAVCFLPLVVVRSNWHSSRYVHDATLGAVLRRAVGLAVQPSHQAVV